ncbi:borealin-like [Culicoides brevitarsis]|uniref:borealin-like n=1 Tax=Culicoides brevitarsis TaxID=469753 RepID=UPI00307B6018
MSPKCCRNARSILGFFIKFHREKMPRTKVAKNNKRSRGVNDEKLQEFEIMVDVKLNELEENYQTALSDIEQKLNWIRNQMPSKVLKLKMSEVRKITTGSFIDSPIVNSSLKTSGTNSFQLSSRNVASPACPPTIARSQHSDEGYLTHEESRKISNGPARMGPFMSAQKKNRRSRSATGSLYTPQLMGSRLAPQNPSRTLLKRTQSGLLGARPSRNKFRTPIMNGRTKAVSVDRLMITPKVTPNTPMAVLRHARTGESVFSVTGSPVITSVSGERMANVNIPIGDAILSIRPTEMGNIDPSYVSRIDKNTIQHLKVLQQNINRIMETASRVQIDQN